MSNEPSPSISATRYGLLMAQTTCHLCQTSTPTAALWVPAFHELDDEFHHEGGAAVLRYIERLDDATLAFVQGHAPWLRMATTRTSGQTYLAHHCATCGAVQGDHFIFTPDSPYWPQDDSALAELRLVDGVGPLKAQASVGESEWMERVEDVCRRD